MTFARHPSITYVSVALLLLPAAAFAQSDPETLERLRACADVEPDAARLACFDEGLAAQEPAVPAATELDGSNDGSVAAPAAVSVTRPATSATRPATIAPESPRTAAEPLDGEDEIDEGPARQSITIVDVRSFQLGDTRFLTQDGRVMVQTSGSSRVRYPEVPFEALLEEGALGGLFLRVAPDGPRVRVAFRN